MESTTLSTTPNETLTNPGLTTIMMICARRPPCRNHQSFSKNHPAEIRTTVIPGHGALSLPRAALLLACLLISLFVAHPPAMADNSDQQKLTALRKQIHSLQQQLERDNQQQDRAVYQLKKIETDIAERYRQLQSINDDINASRQKLASLNQRRETLQQKLASHRDEFTRQVKAAYVLGKQEYVKLLFNQQDPANVARMVVYYQYFNNARARQLNEISNQLGELNKIGGQINDRNARLKTLRQQVIDETRQLKDRRQHRQQIVAKLTTRLQNKDQMLKSLQRDEKHLMRVLNQLQQQPDNRPPPVSNDHLAFAQLKGRLPWPVTGKLAARFGSNRNAGRLKWKGVLIDTATGNHIHAVAAGRVVFADWLRGFGMLVILDHGNGYMSLYGHNRQLHVTLGDRVQANEVIATAGSTGGQQISSLYFEIRHDGVPQNPAKWCKSLPDRG
ncbi:MAG: peptidoglycan DD-metalloendopeptidase family protein [Gammaproteobacteria bacterium]